VPESIVTLLHPHDGCISANANSNGLAVKEIRRKEPMTGWNPWQEPIASRERAVFRILGKKHQTKPLAFTESVRPCCTLSLVCPHRVLIASTAFFSLASIVPRAVHREKGKIAGGRESYRGCMSCCDRADVSMHLRTERQRERERERDFLVGTRA